ncbi:MAG: hypothetical protein AAGA26_00830 [Pseudomonadota bacterium]
MTRSITLAMLVVSLSVSVAQSAPIVLRALDQSNLSRISLGLGEREYAFGQVGLRKYELVVAEPAVSFDTRQIYPDRLASRVISARTIYEDGESRLHFVLNCDCHARTRSVNGNIVIEFEDGSLDEEDTEKYSPDVPSASLQGFAESPDVSAPDFSPRPIAKPTQANNTSPVDGPQEPRSASGSTQEIQPIAKPSTQTVGTSSQNNDHDINLAREKLLEQLTRAAEQGLLDIRGPDKDAEFPLPGEATTSKPVEVTPIQKSDSGVVDEDGSVLAPAPIELPVRSRTAIDRDFIADRSDTLVEADGCLLGDWLAEADWPETKNPMASIAELRGSLVGEFDTPQIDQVENLAQLYLLLGFGAEARHLIELYGAGISSAAILTELSLIVDGEAVPTDGSVDRSPPCSGNAALWRAAAGLPIASNPPRPEIEDELIDALAIMPQRLRKTVGTAALMHFIDTSNMKMARKVQQILQRTPGSGGEKEELALARLIALNGNASAAEAIYAQISSSRSTHANEALVMLVDSLLEREQSIPEDVQDRLGFEAFVTRRGPNGTRLKLREVAARAGSGSLDLLLGELRRRSEVDPAQLTEIRLLGHQLLEETDPDDDGAFAYVQAVTVHADLISTGPDGDAARASVAQRLTSIGLPNAALTLLFPALTRGETSIRIAAGEAFLALRQAEDTLAILETLRSDGALELRSEALMRLGRQDEAMRLLNDEAEVSSTDVAELAWRAGSWERAISEGPSSRRLLAAFMSGSGPDEANISDDRSGRFLAAETLDDNVTLKESQAALEASQTVRNVIEEALIDG